jgi:S-DNA-T family DNA segregation ATPase FtsK/SpoIIIE
LGVVVVDGENLACGPGAPLGWAVAAGAAVAAVVLAPTVAELPATCTTVVRFDGPGGPDGVCSVEHAGGEAHERTLVAGLAPEAARRCARSLARLADPEAGAGEGGLPTAVGLLDALGLPPGPELARALAERWAAAAGSARLPVPLGVGPGGPVVVDLAVDGPHGLVAGTTGSGKSELLRALVAGLAAGRRPDECAFVLVDYKGGAAFDACARLPHVAGVVTDLDAGLAARALRGLEAELGARERRLRAAGVPDLAAFRRAGGDGGGPLPSLVVVVDEFATLRAELPDFVDALVDLARRGRSLGVHLVLATQRPGGVVSDAIRANCSLRVALRVQEPAESCDVVDVPTAAALPPGVPGRAVLRRGPGDAQVLQVPFPGARTPEPGSRPRVAVRAADGPAGPGEEVPTDLERLVAAAGAAAARLGLTSPTPPWLPPLPEALEPAALAGVGGTGEGPAAVIGIADDPDGRRQPPWVWRPDAGNLLVLGTAGSGAEAALVTFVLSLARDHPPGRVHVHAVDAGSGRLAPLAALPHVGTVAGAADRERQERLVRHLLAEVADRRAAGSAGRPLCALVVANLGAFLAAHDDLDGDWVREGLARLAADGPAVGVFVVASADRPGAVPLAVASSMASRLVFRLADPQDATLLGVPAVVGRAPAGRAVDAATGWEVQVALVPGPAVAEGVAEVASRWAGASGGPEPVGVLPVAVALDEVCRRAGEVPGRRAEPGVVVAVPVGVSGRDLAPALLPLGPGDHVLVAGPPRSGRSTALATVAAALRRLRPGVVATVVAPRPSPLVDLGWASRVVGGEEAELAVVAGELATAPGPQLVLIDDADLLDDETGALGRLVRSRRPDLHVVAAGRPDALRSLYGHVTAEVRRSRLGLLLAPVDGDGDLLGMPGLRPPRGPFPPGQGLLVAGGTGDVVQVALPGPDP